MKKTLKQADPAQEHLPFINWNLPVEALDGAHQEYIGERTHRDGVLIEDGCRHLFLWGPRRVATWVNDEGCAIRKGPGGKPMIVHVLQNARQGAAPALSSSQVDDLKEHISAEGRRLQAHLERRFGELLGRSEVLEAARRTTAAAVASIPAPDLPELEDVERALKKVEDGIMVGIASPMLRERLMTLARAKAVQRVSQTSPGVVSDVNATTVGQLNWIRPTRTGADLRGFDEKAIRTFHVAGNTSEIMRAFECL